MKSFVGSPFAQAILTFRGGADGEEVVPVRIIQGPRTQIVSMGNGVDRVAIDPVNSEIYVGTRLNRILVFDREADGDVPPKRILGGPTRDSVGTPPYVVDPVNDFLLVSSRGAMLIFDRTASGNTPPRVIEGVRLNGGAAQFEVYNDLIIYPRDDSIYAWSIHDTGEDARPVLKIPAPLGERVGQLGIALDPEHEDVLIGTGAGNQIRIFSVPEIFDWASTD